MDNEDYYYAEHSWQLKLRQIGRHVRKLLVNCSSMHFRRRRAGYMRFRTEEEQHFRLLTRQDPSVYGVRVARACLLDFIAGWRETSTIFPPGLLSLMPLDRLFVDKEPDGIEALHTSENEKRYRISDASGKLLYTALEESNAWSRCCLGKYRAWDFHLVDKNHREVLRLSRAFKCSSCCFPCCLQRTTVHAGDQLLGSVTQNWNAWRPSFTIRDSLESPVLLMKGPICLCCVGDVDFRIRSVDKQHSVGVITKKWSGLAREFFEEGNSFGIGFPVDLDLKIKAVLIGACFLVDFIYFEEQSNLKRLSKSN